MEKITAYCGLNCGTCPIHLATLEENKPKQQSLRKSIAKQCAENYGMNLQSVDIKDCDGCRANTGRLFSGCLKCEIRQCATLKNMESCAFCVDYVCELLQQHFTLDPDSKIRLDKIRQAN